MPNPLDYGTFDTSRNTTPREGHNPLDTPPHSRDALELLRDIEDLDEFADDYYDAEDGEGGGCLPPVRESRLQGVDGMKLSQQLQDERAFVEGSLGDSEICQECSATLKTFADACTANLQEQCEGFDAIEKAKRDFACRTTCVHCNGSGKVRYYHGDLDTCPTCHGTGAEFPGVPCP